MGGGTEGLGSGLFQRGAAEREIFWKNKMEYTASNSNRLQTLDFSLEKKLKQFEVFKNCIQILFLTSLSSSA